MTGSSRRKDYPISMRLPEADLAVIDRAAGLRGRSRTDFVRDAAVSAAEAVILESSLVRLDPEGFEEFVVAISAPGEPVPAMVKVLARKAPWEEAGGSDDPVGS
ncbi:DUF1778 domain-containing protein [Skermanella pratensis]|uniref:type II toxin-antitoxin system TacA family antitoxin n=1 Tax=Skermanella pratensis TaxID=2233999 RepID=UPI0013015405|nr:DUF1778 domain-containing protein [Skermanella pratensis]